MTCHSEIPRVFNFPHDLQSMTKSGYVCQNIEKFGNSMLPDALLKTLPSTTVARLLGIVTGYEVSVFKRGNIWIAQR